MVNFFIDRPIFAWVLAIIVMLAGAIAVKQLPVAMYPDIAPPSVAISATYPGASAKTLEDTVTQVIEQQMNGIDNLIYMSSSSSGSGNATIILTFAQGTNPDIAQVQVQNKLQLAQPLLPPEVQQQGLRVAKANSNFLMIMNVTSNDGSMSTIDLGNFVASSLQDAVGRVNGVGQINLLGAQYAMRIWMHPEKLNALKLTPVDIINAVKAQNVQIAAGQLGGTPSVQNQRLNATIMAQSRLQTPEQFGNILLRTNSDGSQVRLRDVATLELGGENYEVEARSDRKATTALGISLAAGANALATAKAVKEKVKQLEPYFPPAVVVDFPYDTTPFVEVSIEEVVKTLLEAIVLVFLVILLFLQNFRATLIPTIAVPVVLLGTFGVMAIAGFSINMLTMLGMVLAIGLLVDDAIVVVENVERIMAEEGLSPRDATRKAMGQITGALVGIAVVLAAVFVPMAFLSGSTGAIYRQFTLTMVTAMLLSVVVALVLTPSLCATLLKPGAGAHRQQRGFFTWFNRTFDRGNHHYQSIVRRLIPRAGPVLIAYAVVIGVVVLLFLRLPTAFLPEEDQGAFPNIITLPAGSTQEQTVAVMDKMRDYYLDNEADAVRKVFYVAGRTTSVNGQNVGILFAVLKPWDERKAKELQAAAVIDRARAFSATIKEANVFPISPAPVPELGNSNGFSLELQDRGGVGHEALMAARDQLLQLSRARTELVQVRANGLDDTPMYQLDIDQEKASVLNLDLTDIYSTMTAAFGSSYINDFIDRGRVKKVYVMGTAEARMQPEDLHKWYVRNRDGEMVPFSAFASAHWTYGSPMTERYNGVPSVQIQGAAAPGHSSGEAMRIMEALVAQLPAGIGYEWTGLSYEEKLSGAQAPLLYALSVLVVFLCLAALYESWSIPFSVILVVPLGVLGAVVAATVFGLANDVYFQLGLLTTVGLAAKNAILIVEFAKEQFERGASLADATMEAVRLRLRPIVMTSLAFLLGVLPLAVSSGAGAASRNAIGIGVSGGLLAATFLVIFFVPVFFVTVLSRFGRRPPQIDAAAAQPEVRP